MPRVDELIVSGAPVTMSDTVAVCVWTGDPLSVTLSAKLEFPAAVGVPEMVPPALRLRPAGRLPEATDQVYPGVPPVACTVVVYVLPTWAFARLEKLIASGEAATAIENEAVWVWAGELLSVTSTTKVDVPDPVGVPEIAPLELRVRPAGRLPDFKLQV